MHIIIAKAKPTKNFKAKKHKAWEIKLLANFYTLSTLKNFKKARKRINGTQIKINKYQKAPF